jgi:hypothetical protein
MHFLGYKEDNTPEKNYYILWISEIGDMLSKGGSPIEQLFVKRLLQGNPS